MKSTFQAKLSQHLLAKSEGFTLIELLVVIVIVGVLSAVAVPTFLNQVDRSRFAEGQALLSSVRTAAEVFRFDWSEYPSDPSGLFCGVVNPADPSECTNDEEFRAKDGSSYLDGAVTDIAPNYTLAGDTAGATASGQGKGYDNRVCTTTYGSSGVRCRVGEEE